MTRDYAVTAYGIVLNGRVDEDTLEELASSDQIESYPSFTGEAFPVRDDGSEMWSDGEALRDETLYFVPLSNWPTLFRAAYENMDELVADARERYNGVGGLPKIRSFRKRIRKIVGSYYG